MGTNILKCKIADGVLKELADHAIIYKLVRVVLCEGVKTRSPCAT